jgi:hypothetical protein
MGSGSRGWIRDQLASRIELTLKHPVRKSLGWLIVKIPNWIGLWELKLTSNLLTVGENAGLYLPGDLADDNQRNRQDLSVSQGSGINQSLPPFGRYFRPIHRISKRFSNVPPGPLKPWSSYLL